MTYPDNFLYETLVRAGTIAVVGLSSNPIRPSYGVAAFLARTGYRVVGVNPGLAGQVMFGDAVYATLNDIPFDVDMVEVFRQSDAVPAVVDEALARFPRLQTLWLQIGVSHPEAESRAAARGVAVIANRCPAIEIPRLRALGLDVALAKSKG